MITKTNAIKISTKKWEEIVKRLEHNEEPALLTECGFCSFYMQFGKPRCLSCILYPDICANSRRDDCLFWDIVYLVNFENYADAAPLAKKMLQEIKSRGKKWTKKEDEHE